MRKELWKILQDAYGGPYADKDYNKEGLEELGRILKQQGVTQRIIDVSCFLFMKFFIYERAQTKIEMIVDAMRKNDGVVTLVFDIIQMYKWRYGLALFVRICKRITAMGGDTVQISGLRTVLRPGTKVLVRRRRGGKAAHSQFLYYPFG